MGEEIYNRIIRTEPMTYLQALQLCYRLLKEKADEMDKVDIHSQNLAGDYKEAILLLTELYLHDPKDITNEIKD